MFSLISRFVSLFFLLSLLFALPAKSAEYRQPVISYRALAMGNTGVAAANDSYALSYNPAVLANVRDWWLDLAAWTVESSQGTTPVELLPTLVTLNYPYLNETGLSEAVRASFLSHETPHMRANAGVNFASRLSSSGFAFGANYLREITIQGLENNRILFQRNERISQFGFSIPLGTGQWVLGVSQKNLERRDATSDASIGVPSFGAYEKGTGYDVGLLFRAAGKSQMSLGLVAQNVGGMDIGATKDAEPQEVHFGWSMNLEWGPVRLVPALDVRGIQTTKERKNRVHAGVEFGLFPNETGGNLLSLRSGLNEGYPTNGVELNFFNRSLLLGYTVYYEELGTKAVRQKSSKRALAYLSLGW